MIFYYIHSEHVHLIYILYIFSFNNLKKRNGHSIKLGNCFDKTNNTLILISLLRSLHYLLYKKKSYYLLNYY